jgi:hypothetical protein
LEAKDTTFANTKTIKEEDTTIPSENVKDKMIAEDGEKETKPKKNPEGDLESIVNLETSPAGKYHIFQISGTNVASTMAVNLLTGLFDGADVSVGYLENKSGILNKWKGCDSPMNLTIVTKTYWRNVDELTEHYGSEFDRLFFIGSKWRAKNSFLPKVNTVPRRRILTYFVSNLMTLSTLVSKSFKLPSDM